MDDQRETAMTCPWCGQEMELGYLFSTDSIRWVDRKPMAVFGALAAGRELYVSNEGVVTEYKSCWYCSSCGRLVVELSAGTRLSPEESKEELRRYAEQAKEWT